VPVEARACQSTAATSRTIAPATASRQERIDHWFVCPNDETCAHKISIESYTKGKAGQALTASSRGASSLPRTGKRRTSEFNPEAPIRRRFPQAFGRRGTRPQSGQPMHLLAASSIPCRSDVAFPLPMAKAREPASHEVALRVLRPLPLCSHVVSRSLAREQLGADAVRKKTPKGGREPPAARTNLLLRLDVVGRKQEFVVFRRRLRTISNCDCGARLAFTGRPRRPDFCPAPVMEEPERITAMHQQRQQHLLMKSDTPPSRRIILAARVRPVRLRGRYARSWRILPRRFRGTRGSTFCRVCSRSAMSST